MPTHIHGKRNDSRTNVKMELGLNSWTSPTPFMARLTDSSPAVPATTMKKKRTASRTSRYSCCAGWGPAYEENTETNYRDTKPAQWRNYLAEKKITQNGDGEIGQRRGRLYVTIVCPGQQQHVDDKKSQQAENAKPDIT